ncbi:DJ-1/PfpI family protein [Priestia filamentosa]|uniref:DJ-1/PfpI family protein n=1 Tax=Priestia filamentosa TaxID=1402861 RepID=UPI003F15F2D2
MKRVLLLLADRFEAVEASVFTDVFGWNKIEGNGETELVTAGLREELKCTWNFRVKPEMLLQDVKVEDFDALAIGGGFEQAGYFTDAFSKEFQDIIQQFHQQKKIIGAVCIAALALGKSGILKGKKATTYSYPGSTRKQELQKFGAEVVQAPLIDEGNIITCASPSVGFDVSFLMLEKLTSRKNVEKVRGLMGFS